ncbi:stalk domain-containing protein [Paenibacillus sp. OAS669]|uniref:stalk domain-containing protein n=1 Tax=Paenibacillus sp. OAS669 TaxID=2663821 RepID=UPI001789D577|nr:stalk domain-containing protein [Paenibacillus sp. OAS669]MBE1446078.1 hypothetical protein [Paenibacillus sp. OAS669]
MRKKLMAGVIGTTLLMGMGTGALAASSLEEIKAFLNGEIKFKVNGADWRPSDENGSELMPITYNGSTYVPLRAVSNALNTPVDYNDETKTVILGEKVDGMNLFSSDVKYKRTFGGDAEEIIDKEQLVVAGKQFNGAFRQKFDAHGGSFKIDKIDFGKQYTKMNAIIGAKGADITVQIQNEKGQVLKEVKLSKDEVKEVSVELGNTQRPIFAVSAKNEGYFYLFKESTVK